MAKKKISRQEAVFIITKLLMHAGDCGKWISLKEMTRAVHRDARTVKRMISQMKIDGATIENRRNLGYRMTSPPSGAALAPFIPDELLVILRKLAASLAGTPWHAQLDRLLGKQVAALRSHAKTPNSTMDSRIERISNVIFIADFALPTDVVPDQKSKKIKYTYDSDELQKKWMAMLQAAIDQRVIQVKYRSVQGVTSFEETRQLLPIHILIRHGGAYALCKDLSSGTPEKIKSFALHRLIIDSSQARQDQAAHPTVIRATKIESSVLRNRMEEAVDGLPDDNEPMDVELVYRDLPQDRPYSALNMGLGEIWTKKQTQCICETRDPSTRTSSNNGDEDRAKMELHVSFTTSSKIATLRRVLAYGGRVVLLKPESWRREILAATKCLAQVH